MSTHAIIIASAILLFACAVLLGGLAIRNWRRASASKSWPRVPGRILTSTIRETTTTDSEGTPSTSYEVRLEYEYIVAGQSFRAKRIAFGATSFGSLAKAQQVAAQYSAGTQPEVFYDPAKPSDAVLETRATGANIILMIGAVICLIGGVVLALI